MLKIDRNANTFRRIQTMAASCFRTEESIFTNLEDFNGHANITVSGFIVRTIYLGTNKPINENLLLKFIHRRNVFMPYSNISEMLVDLLIKGVAHKTPKGYALTDSMMELIGEYATPAETSNAAEQTGS